MRGIILIAPPAAGKGTQSNFICEKYGFVHISTGDLLREAALEDTLEGLYIKEKIESGELIDDELMTNILLKKLQSIKTKGFVLDGFPRDMHQAEMLETIIEQINLTKLYVFHIDTDFNIIMKRFTGRISCPNCGHVYNSLIKELRPKKEGICDICKCKLVTRADDNEETFTKRYEIYANQTEPIVAYYDKKNILYHLNGNKTAEEISNQIMKILEGDQDD